MTARPAGHAPPALPELGGALPALVAPATPVPADEPQLAHARLALATHVLAAAAVARQALAGGRPAEAVAALDRSVWEQAWDAARAAAADAVLRAAEVRLLRAAGGVGLSRRRLGAWLPQRVPPLAATPAGPPRQGERRRPPPELPPLPIADAPLRNRDALARRLGADAAPLFAALDRLESAGRVADTAEAIAAWVVDVERTARRLDEVWRRLADAADAETRRWIAVTARVQQWRPSPWPLAVAVVGLIALGLWGGLMLGGWIDVPGPLRPLADRVWGLR